MKLGKSCATIRDQASFIRHKWGLSKEGIQKSRLLIAIYQKGLACDLPIELEDLVQQVHAELYRKKQALWRVLADIIQGTHSRKEIAARENVSEIIIKHQLAEISLIFQARCSRFPDYKMDCWLAAAILIAAQNREGRAQENKDDSQKAAQQGGAQEMKEFREGQQQQTGQVRLEILTSDEKETLQLVARNWIHKDIARKLGKRESTIIGLTQRIRRKFGFIEKGKGKRGELLAMIYREGLVQGLPVELVKLVSQISRELYQNKRSLWRVFNEIVQGAYSVNEIVTRTNLLKRRVEWQTSQIGQMFRKRCSRFPDFRMDCWLAAAILAAALRENENEQEAKDNNSSSPAGVGNKSHSQSHSRGVFRFLIPDISRIAAERNDLGFYDDLRQGKVHHTFYPQDDALLQKLGMSQGESVYGFAGFVGEWLAELRRLGARVTYTDLDPRIVQWVARFRWSRFAAKKSVLARAVRISDPLQEPAKPLEFDWSFSYEPIPLEGLEIPMVLLRALLNRQGLLWVSQQAVLRKDLITRLRTFASAYGLQDRLVQEKAQPAALPQPGDIDCRSTKFLALSSKAKYGIQPVPVPLAVITLRTNGVLLRRAELDLAVLEALSLFRRGSWESLSARVGQQRGRAINRKVLEESLRRITALALMVPEAYRRTISIAAASSAATANNRASSPVQNQRDKRMALALKYLQEKGAITVTEYSALLRSHPEIRIVTRTQRMADLRMLARLNGDILPVKSKGKVTYRLDPGKKITSSPVISRRLTGKSLERLREMAEVIPELHAKLGRKPNQSEVAVHLVRTLPEGPDQKKINTFIKWWNATGLDAAEHGMQKFSGLAEQTIAKEFSFAGYRMRLPPWLRGKMRIVQPLEVRAHAKTVTIKSIERKGGEVVLVQEGDKIRLTYRMMNRAVMTSEIRPSEDAVVIQVGTDPCFLAVRDALSNIPFRPSAKRASELLKRLKEYGIRKRATNRNISFAGCHLMLPSYYRYHPERIMTLRDADIHSTRVALIDSKNGQNYVIFEYKGGEVYTAASSKPLLRNHAYRGSDRNKVQWTYDLSACDDFRAFDEALNKLDRPTELNRWNSMSNVGILLGHFAFWTDEDVEVIDIQTQRARYTRDDATRYPLTLRFGPLKDRQIVIRSYQGDNDRFVIDGLSWADGAPLILDGKYFNLSVVMELVRSDAANGLLTATETLLEFFTFPEDSELSNGRQRRVNGYVLNTATKALYPGRRIPVNRLLTAGLTIVQIPNSSETERGNKSPAKQDEAKNKKDASSPVRERRQHRIHMVTHLDRGAVSAEFKIGETVRMLDPSKQSWGAGTVTRQYKDPQMNEKVIEVEFPGRPAVTVLLHAAKTLLRREATAGLETKAAYMPPAKPEMPLKIYRQAIKKMIDDIEKDMKAAFGGDGDIGKIEKNARVVRRKKHTTSSPLIRAVGRFSSGMIPSGYQKISRREGSRRVLRTASPRRRRASSPVLTRREFARSLPAVIAAATEIAPEFALGQSGRYAQRELFGPDVLAEGIPDLITIDYGVVKEILRKLKIPEKAIGNALVEFRNCFSSVSRQEMLLRFQVNPISSAQDFRQAIKQPSKIQYEKAVRALEGLSKFVQWRLGTTAGWRFMRSLVTAFDKDIFKTIRNKDFSREEFAQIRAILEKTDFYSVDQLPCQEKELKGFLSDDWLLDCNIIHQAALVAFLYFLAPEFDRVYALTTSNHAYLSVDLPDESNAIWVDMSKKIVCLIKLSDYLHSKTFSVFRRRDPALYRELNAIIKAQDGTKFTSEQLEMINDFYQSSTGFAASFLNDIASVYSFLGEEEKALGYLKQAIQADPNYYKAYLNIGSRYMLRIKDARDTDNIFEAEKYLSRAVELVPADYMPHYRLSLLYYRARRPERMERHLREAVRINPYHAESFYNLGIVFYMYSVISECDKEQNLRQAVGFWRKALELDPSLKDLIVKEPTLPEGLKDRILTAKALAGSSPIRTDESHSRGVILITPRECDFRSHPGSVIGSASSPVKIYDDNNRIAGIRSGEERYYVRLAAPDGYELYAKILSDIAIQEEANNFSGDQKEFSFWATSLIFKKFVDSLRNSAERSDIGAVFLLTDEAEENIKGAILLYKRTLLPDLGLEGVEGMVAIRTECQGKGVGTVFIEAALDWMRQQGHHVFVARIHEDNEMALRHFQRVAEYFRTEIEEVPARQMNWSLCNAYIMRLPEVGSSPIQSHSRGVIAPSKNPSSPIELEQTLDPDGLDQKVAEIKHVLENETGEEAIYTASRRLRKGIFLRADIDEMFAIFKAIRLSGNQQLLDLGGGIGDVVFTASAFGAMGTSVEFDPLLALISETVKTKLTLSCSNVSRVNFIHGDFFDINLGKFDVITYHMYGTYQQERLLRKVARELKTAGLFIPFGVTIEDLRNPSVFFGLVPRGIPGLPQGSMALARDSATQDHDGSSEDGYKGRYISSPIEPKSHSRGVILITPRECDFRSHPGSVMVFVKDGYLVSELIHGPPEEFGSGFFLSLIYASSISSDLANLNNSISIYTKTNRLLLLIHPWLVEKAVYDSDQAAYSFRPLRGILSSSTVAGDFDGKLSSAAAYGTYPSRVSGVGTASSPLDSAGTRENLGTASSAPQRKTKGYETGSPAEQRTDPISSSRRKFMGAVLGVGAAAYAGCRSRPKAAGLFGTFRQFMQEAMYNPHFGYYMKKPGFSDEKGEGDYSPINKALASQYAWAIAEHVFIVYYSMLDAGMITSREPIYLIEPGAGDGKGTKRVLEVIEQKAGTDRAWWNLWNAVRAVTLDISPDLVRQQAAANMKYQNRFRPYICDVTKLADRRNIPEDLRGKHPKGIVRTCDVLDSFPPDKILISRKGVAMGYVLPHVDAGLLWKFKRGGLLNLGQYMYSSRELEDMKKFGRLGRDRVCLAWEGFIRMREALELLGDENLIQEFNNAFACSEGYFDEGVYPELVAHVLQNIDDVSIALACGNRDNDHLVTFANPDISAYLRGVGNLINAGDIITFEVGFGAKYWSENLGIEPLVVIRNRGRETMNPYLFPGRQMIAVGVNFKALANAGNALGWRPLLYAGQLDYVMACRNINGWTAALPPYYEPYRDWYLQHFNNDSLNVLVQRKGKFWHMPTVAQQSLEYDPELVSPETRERAEAIKRSLGRVLERQASSPAALARGQALADSRRPSLFSTESNRLSTRNSNRVILSKVRARFMRMPSTVTFKMDTSFFRPDTSLRTISSPSPKTRKSERSSSINTPTWVPEKTSSLGELLPSLFFIIANSPFAAVLRRGILRGNEGIIGLTAESVKGENAGAIAWGDKRHEVGSEMAQCDASSSPVKNIDKLRRAEITAQNARNLRIMDGNLKAIYPSLIRREEEAFVKVQETSLAPGSLYITQPRLSSLDFIEYRRQGLKTGLPWRAIVIQSTDTQDIFRGKMFVLYGHHLAYAAALPDMKMSVPAYLLTVPSEIIGQYAAAISRVFSGRFLRIPEIPVIPMEERRLYVQPRAIIEEIMSLIENHDKRRETLIPFIRGIDQPGEYLMAYVDIRHALPGIKRVLSQEKKPYQAWRMGDSRLKLVHKNERPVTMETLMSSSPILKKIGVCFSFDVRGKHYVLQRETKGYEASSAPQRKTKGYEAGSPAEAGKKRGRSDAASSPVNKYSELDERLTALIDTITGPDYGPKRIQVMNFLELVSWNSARADFFLRFFKISNVHHPRFFDTLHFLALRWMNPDPSGKEDLKTYFLEERNRLIRELAESENGQAQGADIPEVGMMSGHLFRLSINLREHRIKIRQLNYLLRAFLSDKVLETLHVFEGLHGAVIQSKQGGQYEIDFSQNPATLAQALACHLKIEILSNGGGSERREIRDIPQEQLSEEIVRLINDLAQEITEHHWILFFKEVKTGTKEKIPGVFAYGNISERGGVIIEMVNLLRLNDKGVMSGLFAEIGKRLQAGNKPTAVAAMLKELTTLAELALCAVEVSKEDYQHEISIAREVLKKNLAKYIEASRVQLSSQELIPERQAIIDEIMPELCVIFKEYSLNRDVLEELLWGHIYKKMGLADITLRVVDGQLYLFGHFGQPGDNDDWIRGFVSRVPQPLIEARVAGLSKINVSLNIKLNDPDRIREWINSEPNKHLVKCSLGKTVRDPFGAFSQIKGAVYDYDVVRLHGPQGEEFSVLAFSAMGPGFFNNRLETWAVIDGDGKFMVLEEVTTTTGNFLFYRQVESSLNIAQGLKCISIGNPYVMFSVTYSEGSSSPVKKQTAPSISTDMEGCRVPSMEQLLKYARGIDQRLAAYPKRESILEAVNNIKIEIAVLAEKLSQYQQSHTGIFGYLGLKENLVALQRACRMAEVPISVRAIDLQEIRETLRSLSVRLNSGERGVFNRTIVECIPDLPALEMLTFAGVRTMADLMRWLYAPTAISGLDPSAVVEIRKKLYAVPFRNRLLQALAAQWSLKQVAQALGVYPKILKEWNIEPRSYRYGLLAKKEILAEKMQILYPQVKSFERADWEELGGAFKNAVDQAQQLYRDNNGRWPAALRRAGLPKQRGLVFGKEAILNAVNEGLSVIGKSSETWSRHKEYGKWFWRAVARFGSWPAALKELDQGPLRRRTAPKEGWTKTNIIREALTHLPEVRSLSSRVWFQWHGGIYKGMFEAAKREFGSWPNMVTKVKRLAVLRGTDLSAYEMYRPQRNSVRNGLDLKPEQEDLRGNGKAVSLSAGAIQLNKTGKEIYDWAVRRGAKSRAMIYTGRKIAKILGLKPRSVSYNLPKVNQVLRARGNMLIKTKYNKKKKPVRDPETKLYNWALIRTAKQKKTVWYLKDLARATDLSVYSLRTYLPAINARLKKEGQTLIRIRSDQYKKRTLNPREILYAWAAGRDPLQAEQKLKQTQIASLAGISQSAVSKYLYEVNQQLRKEGKPLIQMESGELRERISRKKIGLADILRVIENGEERKVFLAKGQTIEAIAIERNMLPRQVVGYMRSSVRLLEINLSLTPEAAEQIYSLAREEYQEKYAGEKDGESDDKTSSPLDSAGTRKNLGTASPRRRRAGPPADNRKSSARDRALFESLETTLAGITRTDFLSAFDLNVTFPAGKRSESRFLFRLENGCIEEGFIDYERSRDNRKNVIYLVDQGGIDMSTVLAVSVVDMEPAELDYFVNAVPFILSNETESEVTIHALRRRASDGRDVHIGVAGWFNLNLIFARQSDYGIFVDRNGWLIDFFKEMQRMPWPRARQDFVTMVKYFLNSRRSRGKYVSEDFKLIAADDGKTVYDKELERPDSWLGSDESYDYINRMFSEDRLFFLRADLRDTALFQALGEWLIAEGLKAETIYLSNVHQYLSRDGDEDTLLNRSSAYVANSKTIFIESYMFGLTFMDCEIKQFIYPAGEYKRLSGLPLFGDREMGQDLSRKEALDANLSARSAGSFGTSSQTGKKGLASSPVNDTVKHFDELLRRGENSGWLDVNAVVWPLEVITDQTGQCVVSFTRNDQGHIWGETPLRGGKMDMEGDGYYGLGHRFIKEGPIENDILATVNVRRKNHYIKIEADGQMDLRIRYSTTGTSSGKLAELTSGQIERIVLGIRSRFTANPMVINIFRQYLSGSLSVKSITQCLKLHQFELNQNEKGLIKFLLSLPLAGKHNIPIELAGELIQMYGDKDQNDFVELILMSKLPIEKFSRIQEAYDPDVISILQRLNEVMDIVEGKQVRTSRAGMYPSCRTFLNALRHPKLDGGSKDLIEDFLCGDWSMDSVIFEFLSVSPAYLIDKVLYEHSDITRFRKERMNIEGKVEFMFKTLLFMFEYFRDIPGLLLKYNPCSFIVDNWDLFLKAPELVKHQLILAATDHKGNLKHSEGYHSKFAVYYEEAGSILEDAQVFAASSPLVSDDSAMDTRGEASPVPQRKTKGDEAGSPAEIVTENNAIERILRESTLNPQEQEIAITQFNEAISLLQEDTSSLANEALNGALFALQRSLERASTIVRIKNRKVHFRTDLFLIPVMADIGAENINRNEQRQAWAYLTCAVFLAGDYPFMPVLGRIKLWAQMSRLHLIMRQYEEAAAWADRALKFIHQVQAAVQRGGAEKRLITERAWEEFGLHKDRKKTLNDNAALVIYFKVLAEGRYSIQSRQYQDGLTKVLAGLAVYLRLRMRICQGPIPEGIQEVSLEDVLGILESDIAELNKYFEIDDDFLEQVRDMLLVVRRLLMCINRLEDSRRVSMAVNKFAPVSKTGPGSSSPVSLPGEETLDRSMKRLTKDGRVAKSPGRKRKAGLPSEIVQEMVKNIIEEIFKRHIVSLGPFAEAVKQALFESLVQFSSLGDAEMFINDLRNARSVRTTSRDPLPDKALVVHEGLGLGIIQSGTANTVRVKFGSGPDMEISREHVETSRTCASKKKRPVHVDSSWEKITVARRFRTKSSRASSPLRERIIKELETVAGRNVPKQLLEKNIILPEGMWLRPGNWLRELAKTDPSLVQDSLNRIRKNLLNRGAWGGHKLGMHQLGATHIKLVLRSSDLQLWVEELGDNRNKSLLLCVIKSASQVIILDIFGRIGLHKLAKKKRLKKPIQNFLKALSKVINSLSYRQPSCGFIDAITLMKNFARNRWAGIRYEEIVRISRVQKHIRPFLILPFSVARTKHYLIEKELLFAPSCKQPKNGDIVFDIYSDGIMHGRFGKFGDDFTALSPNRISGKAGIRDAQFIVELADDLVKAASKPDEPASSPLETMIPTDVTLGNFRSIYDRCLDIAAGYPATREEFLAMLRQSFVQVPPAGISEESARSYAIEAEGIYASTITYLRQRGYSPNSLGFIARAFPLPLLVHTNRSGRGPGGQMPFFFHPLRVQNKLVTKYEITGFENESDAVEDICVAIAHDIIEDASKGIMKRWGALEGIEPQDRDLYVSNEAAKLMKDLLGERLLEKVMRLTKVPKGIFNSQSVEEAEIFFITQQAEQGERLIKLADWDDNFEETDFEADRVFSLGYIRTRIPLIIRVLEQERQRLDKQEKPVPADRLSLFAESVRKAVCKKGWERYFADEAASRYLKRLEALHAVFQVSSSPATEEAVLERNIRTLHKMWNLLVVRDERLAKEAEIRKHMSIKVLGMPENHALAGALRLEVWASPGGVINGLEEVEIVPYYREYEQRKILYKWRAVNQVTEQDVLFEIILDYPFLRIRHRPDYPDQDRFIIGKSVKVFNLIVMNRIGDFSNLSSSPAGPAYSAVHRRYEDSAFAVPGYSSKVIYGVSEEDKYLQRESVLDYFSTLLSMIQDFSEEALADLRMSLSELINNSIKRSEGGTVIYSRVQELSATLRKSAILSVCKNNTYR
ncbi:MAG: SAM-dependent methyltransferase [Candidatus Omnitrophica bacterium]|nr:SAM-dependent methyltransferase [Candidatus Omnitrophota bacterium]